MNLNYLFFTAAGVMAIVLGLYVIGLTLRFFILLAYEAWIWRCGREKRAARKAVIEAKLKWTPKAGDSRECT